MTAKSVVLAALMMLVVAPAAVFAQSYAIQGVEHYLRVDASASQGRRGPVVSGYVYNKYGQTADRVRLAVETLDGAGQVTSTKITEVYGGIPPLDRAYFEVPVDSASGQYRVRPLSFDPVGRGQ
jgi:hypothetical protein